MDFLCLPDLPLGVAGQAAMFPTDAPIRTNVRSISFRWVHTKPISSPTFSYSSPPPFQSHSNFFGIIVDCIFFFSKHVSLLKAKFSPRLKALRCVSASSWGLFKEPLFFFCIKLFFGHFSLMLHADTFLLLALVT